jgi:hypothetical protein
VSLPSKQASDLADPVRLEANGKPIDTEIGHAAPSVGDFEGGRRQSTKSCEKL